MSWIINLNNFRLIGARNIAKASPHPANTSSQINPNSQDHQETEHSNKFQNTPNAPKIANDRVQTKAEIGTNQNIQEAQEMSSWARSTILAHPAITMYLTMRAEKDDDVLYKLPINLSIDNPNNSLLILTISGRSHDESGTELHWIEPSSQATDSVASCYYGYLGIIRFGMESREACMPRN